MWVGTGSVSWNLLLLLDSVSISTSEVPEASLLTPCEHAASSGLTARRAWDRPSGSPRAQP